MGEGLKEMRNIVLVGIIGIITAVVYAWEPGPRGVENAAGAAGVSAAVAGAPCMPAGGGGVVAAPTGPGGGVQLNSGMMPQRMIPPIGAGVPPQH